MTRLNRRIGLIAGAIIAVGTLLALVPSLQAVGTDILSAFDASYVRSTLRFTVPIAFAGLGGIFAEKSGVINIGLEGLLIIGAFSAIAVGWYLGGRDGGTLLVPYAIAVLITTLVAAGFAVITIEFKADQIIAGLAVWLIALGFAPFASIVIWETTNSPSIGSLDRIALPVLSELPYVGPALFNVELPVYLLYIAVVLSWYLLTRTPFGNHLEASGEDPTTLDTVGVNVSRIRYAGVILSGVYCGIGGAGLALNAGQFVGGGETMTSGRGWIGLTTYLIANYNPLGTALAGLLFASLDALQLTLQRVGTVELSSALIETLPYVAVLVILAFVGKTQMPAAAGEHYDTED